MRGPIEKNNYPKVSDHLYNGAILTYIGGVLFMISFCSPYWVKSYTETFSSFKNMGIWQYCFDEFRYPLFQFDKLFNGCHHVFSKEYHAIREWLLPGWLLAVQAFMTMSFLLSFGAQAIMALQVVRFPLRLVLRYEWIISSINFGMITTTTVFMFLSFLIFGCSYTRRDWLMYPNFNFLTWGYWLGVISLLFHALAAVSLYKEARLSYELKQESKNLIMQMQPNPQHRLGWSIY
ncbi:uncharacterized protein LOC123677862 [Harmonia axyridis]|uniref:uncharacterized protein LOC123677862 n=1 Tax=Harmonia axyridis TaxID=115357 RepID=UPI001E278722|nr:uncharacterized protein LOC123677862 [Harmonia axyridis]